MQVLNTGDFWGHNLVVACQSSRLVFIIDQSVLKRFKDCEKCSLQFPSAQSDNFALINEKIKSQQILIFRTSKSLTFWLVQNLN